MPNRILRDWTDSEAVNSVSIHAERFFTRLIMKADDYGRYPNNIKLIKSTLYPLLADQVREADLSRYMAECQKAGLILLYEVGGKQYLQIEQFKQTIRIKKQKYPPPKKEPEKPAQHVHSTCIADAHLEKEMKRNGDGDETQPPSPPPDESLRNGEIDAINCGSIKEKILKDEILIESVCMANRLEIETCKQHINRFFSDKAATLHKWENESDLRNHLLSWMPKFIAGKIPSVSTQKPSSKILRPIGDDRNN